MEAALLSDMLEQTFFLHGLKPPKKDSWRENQCENLETCSDNMCLLNFNWVGSVQ